jgi:hypothetical protein
MTPTRLLVALNVLLLGTLATRELAPAFAAGEARDVLRGRALEIVDSQGRVRASLSVLPAGPQSPETVLLRLITEQGRPSVKISASEPASGVSLAGTSGTKDTYVILEARGNASSLRLRNEDGREQALRP